MGAGEGVVEGVKAPRGQTNVVAWHERGVAAPALGPHARACHQNLRRRLLRIIRKPARADADGDLLRPHRVLAFGDHPHRRQRVRKEDMHPLQGLGKDCIFVRRAADAAFIT